MVFIRFALYGFQSSGAIRRALQPDTYFIKGDDGGEDTPLPFPNRVVKLASADGTAGSPRGRVGRRPFFCLFWCLRVDGRSLHLPPVYSSRNGNLAKVRQVC